MKLTITYFSSGFLPKGLSSTAKKHNASTTIEVVTVPEEAPLILP